MGRGELLLVFLVGCSDGFVDEPEEGRYSAGVAPDAKIDRGFHEPVPDAPTDAGADAEPDAAKGVAAVDAGSCVRDESRDQECAGDADAEPRYAIACPADDAGNPVLPPPAIGCNYTGWADAGSLTMCCK